MFGIIRPHLSEDKTDAPLYLHPEQGCNSCSRLKMARIRSYLYTYLRLTELLLCESRSLGEIRDCKLVLNRPVVWVAFQILSAKSTVAYNRKPGTNCRSALASNFVN